MSQPLIDGMASFTLEMEAGTTGLRIRSDQQQAGKYQNNRRIYLDPGVYSLIAFFDAARSVSILLARDIHAGYTTTKILEVPDGAEGAFRQVATSISVPKESALIMTLNSPPTAAMITTGYSPGLIITHMGIPME